MDDRIRALRRERADAPRTDPIAVEAEGASPEDLDELFRETLREVWGPAG